MNLLSRYFISTLEKSATNLFVLSVASTMR